MRLYVSYRTTAARGGGGGGLPPPPPQSPQAQNGYNPTRQLQTPLCFGTSWPSYALSEVSLEEVSSKLTIALV
jgi:hypothetical protein